MCMERSKICSYFLDLFWRIAANSLYITYDEMMLFDNVQKICWKCAVLDHDVAMLQRITCSNFGAPYKHYMTEFIAHAQVNPIC